MSTPLIDPWTFEVLGQVSADDGFTGSEVPSKPEAAWKRELTNFAQHAETSVSIKCRENPGLQP